MWGICNITWLFQVPQESICPWLPQRPRKLISPKLCRSIKEYKNTLKAGIFIELITWPISFFIGSTLSVAECLLALHGEWVLGRSVSLTDEITGSCVISGAVCRFPLLCRTHQPTWMAACASDWACAWMAAEKCNDSLHCAFLVCKRHELIAGTFFLYYQVAIVSSATTKEDDDNIIPFMPRDSSRAVALYLCLRDNHVLFMGI